LLTLGAPHDRMMRINSIIAHNEAAAMGYTNVICQ
jgi:hypothetical protein